jgi:ribokinase
MKKQIDFLAIGDTLTDAFIALENAEVHCDIDHNNCRISMPFGEKIPYQSVTVLRGVGNAANAAVAAKRIGQSASLVATVGDDEEGVRTQNHFTTEGIDTTFLSVQPGINTNYHYVLSYQAERTILIKHEHYHYDLPVPELDNYDIKTVYLTSIASGTEQYHKQLSDWLNTRPEITLAFQPGTFQINVGTGVLSEIYKRTNVFFCNKQEAQKILGLPDADFRELHDGIRNLGPQTVIITDGPAGMTASDETTGYFLPIYPDPQPPVERTGAGDACSSTIAIALSMGLPLDQAIMWGPINSMSVVQYVGAQAGLLSREQLDQYLADAPADYIPKQIW